MEIDEAEKIGYDATVDKLLAAKKRTTVKSARRARGVIGWKNLRTAGAAGFRVAGFQWSIARRLRGSPAAEFRFARGVAFVKTRSVPARLEENWKTAQKGLPRAVLG